MVLGIEVLDELKVLAMFNLANGQEGIKIHHSAEPGMIDAARRLHDKGLVSQLDGGYLTPLGFQAADHAQALLGILSQV